MNFLFDLINKPLGWILRSIAGVLNGNFAAAVFVFTLFINVVLIPLSIKSQKSSVQQARIKPKLDALKKACGDDRVKYNEGMQKIYQEEGVSASGGCLPMILRLVLMMSIYWLIMSPLTYMTGAENAQIKNVTTTITTAMSDLKKEDKALYEKYTEELRWSDRSSQNELGIVNIIRDEKAKEILPELLSDEEYKKIEKDLKEISAKDTENHIDYTFFSEKLDLTETPKFSFDIFNDFRLIWIMPILAFAAQILSSLLSMAMQKKINPEAPSMAGMLLTMPLISLFIGFSLPGGVAFYWACSSLIGGVIQVGVQNFYGPHKIISKERGAELTKQCDFEMGQIKKLS